MEKSKTKHREDPFQHMIGLIDRVLRKLFGSGSRAVVGFCMWLQNHPKVRYVMASILVVAGAVTAMTGMLSWDLAYYLGMPRISVYWLKYFAGAIGLFSVGIAVLLVVRPEKRATVTVLVAIGLVFATLWQSLPWLYLSRIGVLEYSSIKYNKKPPFAMDANIAANTYMEDKYDHTGFAGEITIGRYTMASYGRSSGFGGQYDKYYWVAKGDIKLYDATQEIVERAKRLLNDTKDYIYQLPFKDQIEKTMQDARSEMKKFEKAQEQANRNK